MSGHLFFADRYFGFDDAIYASLRLLEILAARSAAHRRDARGRADDVRDAGDPRRLPRRDQVRRRRGGARALHGARATGRRHRRRARSRSARAERRRRGGSSARRTRGPILVHALRGDERRASATRSARGRAGRATTRAARDALSASRAPAMTTSERRRQTVDNRGGAPLGDRRLSRRAASSSPRLDAELLLGARARRRRACSSSSTPSGRSSRSELARFRDLVKRRRAREPVAYLLGEREFYGRPFRVDRRVLIPRPDTETLVEVALDRTRGRSLSMRALDLCTGSGCVAITLARERPTDARPRDRPQRATRSPSPARTRSASARTTSASAAATSSPPSPAGAALRPHRREPAVHRDRRDRGARAATSATSSRALALDGGADGLALVRRIVDRRPALLAPGRGPRGRGRRRRSGRRRRALRGARFHETSTITRDYGTRRAGRQRRLAVIGRLAEEEPAPAC